MGIQLSGLASGMDTESMIKDLMKIEHMKVDRVKKQKTEVEWKKEAWQAMNKKLYDFYTKDLYKMKMSSTFTKNSVANSNPSVATVSANSGSIEGNHTVNVQVLAKGSSLNGNVIDTNVINKTTMAQDIPGIDFGGLTSITVKVGSTATMKDVTIDNTDTVAQIITKIQAADSQLKLNFDTNFKRIFASTSDTGATMNINLDSQGSDLFESLGFTALTGTVGVDARIDYNGTIVNSSSNTFSLGGVSIQAHTTGTTTLSVTKDTDAVYKEVKDFILKYNEIVMDINAKTDVKAARGYAPLTSEEKEAMSENDIKLWEEKAKSDLLRRDPILTSIENAMRSITVSSSGVDTTGMDYKYMKDLGIVTGNYLEKGVLHIEGDEDDSTFSAKENKLKKALEDNPEGVAQFLNAVGEKLYSTLSDKMKSTELSSALTFYNDKQIDKQIDKYDTEIYKLEDRLVTIQERYYKQFTAMEKAMQQSNSTSQWLSQQLGGM